MTMENVIFVRIIQHKHWFGSGGVVPGDAAEDTSEMARSLSPHLVLVN